jgi:ABC-type amino acid transport substrate-binding protein
MKTVLPTRKKRAIYSSVGLMTLLILSFLPLNAPALEDSTASGKLLIGAADFPPYSMKTKEGKWEGFGIDLWKTAAKELGVEYEIREYDWLRQIRDAVQKGELDLTTAIQVTEHNETITDLSHSYYLSGLGIALAAERHGNRWIAVTKRLVSIDTLKVVVLLILMSSIAGMIVWIFERRENREMFGGRLTEGLMHGIWWAMVTMTTVGYGDKAPKTAGGRMVAVIWMFSSIILIANYTAFITTSLTVSELSGRVNSPRDLPDVRVGSLAQSETLGYLVTVGIPVLPFENLQEGLRAVVENRIDAFVDDESQLRYLIKTEFPGQLRVLAETFNHHYMSMAMPAGSPLREPLNRALARILENDVWKRLQERYLGKIH